MKALKKPQSTSYRNPLHQLAKPRGEQRIGKKMGELLQKGEHQKAIDFAKNQQHKGHKSDQVTMLLTEAYVRDGDFERAEAVFDPLLKKAKVPESLHARLGMIYLSIRRSAFAKPHLEKAQKNPKTLNPQGWMNYARSLLRMHKVDEAREIIERYESQKQHFPHFHLAKADLLRAEKNYEQAESYLIDSLKGPLANFTGRANGYYILANIRDKTKRYKEAMEALLEAKKLQTQRVPKGTYGGRIFKTRHMRMLAQSFSSEKSKGHSWIKSWATQAKKTPSSLFEQEQDMGKNLALLCGHPRSGTTLLEQIIDSHDGVIASDESSIMMSKICQPMEKRLRQNVSQSHPLNFEKLEAFAKKNLPPQKESYHKATETYLQESLKGRILVEKQPELSSMLHVACRAYPEAKIIMPLRDPRDVCISCFFLESDGLSSYGVSWINLKETAQLYADIMNIWLALREQLPNEWVQIKYEDLVEDFESQAKKCLQFLGLEWQDDISNFHQRAQTKVLNSPNQDNVTQKIYSRAKGRWQNYEEHLAEALPILEPLLKDFDYR